MYSIVLMMAMTGPGEVPAYHSSAVTITRVHVFQRPLLRGGCAGAPVAAATGCHGFAFPRLHEARERFADRPRLHLTVSRPMARTGCAGTAAALAPVPPPVKMPEPAKKK